MFFFFLFSFLYLYLYLYVTDEADENPDDEFEILTDLEDGAEEN